MVRDKKEKGIIKRKNEMKEKRKKKKIGKNSNFVLLVLILRFDSATHPSLLLNGSVPWPLFFKPIHCPQMRGRYFTLSNSLDWLIYIVALVFVFDITIHIDFPGCTGPKVFSLICKIFFPLQTIVAGCYKSLWMFREFICKGPLSICKVFQWRKPILFVVLAVANRFVSADHVLAQPAGVHQVSDYRPFNDRCCKEEP